MKLSKEDILNTIADAQLAEFALFSCNLVDTTWHINYCAVLQRLERDAQKIQTENLEFSI